MSGETESRPSALTLDTFKDQTEQLRRCDEKFQEERDRRYAEVSAERDRRYTEVSIEKEKALKIKETADREAKILAKSLQDDKDEQHNGLLKQHAEFVSKAVTQTELRISLEKVEATIKPVIEYVIAQQGRSKGIDKTVATIVTIIGVGIAILTFNN